MIRTIVIGDVHGCIYELHNLLFDVLCVAPPDRIIFLGDLIDRGPDSAAVVALAKGINAECIMGNHEEKALRWRRHEQKRKEDPEHYKNPMRSIDQVRLDQWAKIPDEHWDWISTLPKFIHINDEYVGVHAGCMPNVEIENQVSNELMRLRYVKCTVDSHGYSKYKMASLQATGKVQDPKIGEQIVHWTELWSGPKSIIYGHYIWDDVHFTKTDGVTSVTTWGIDTGCVHGGRLTALELVKDKLPQIYDVQAFKVYAERKPWNEE